MKWIVELQEGGLYVIDWQRESDQPKGLEYFLFCVRSLTDWTYCNKALPLMSPQISIFSFICLYQSVSLSFHLYICFLHNPSASPSFHPPFHPLPLSLCLSCQPDCCRALTEKKHSEIWHCIIMPPTCTYHSLAAPLRTSPVLILWLWVSSWVYWPCHGSCQAQKTTGTHVVVLDIYKPQRTAVKGFKTVICGVGLLFGPSVVCCKHPPEGSPVEAALWQVRGTLLPSSKNRLLLLPVSGKQWLSSFGAFTQSFVPALPRGVPG